MKKTAKIEVARLPGDTATGEEIASSAVPKFKRWSARLEDNCPQCGEQLTRCVRKNGFVMGQPCGCRIWRGPLPEAWRK